MQRKRKMNTWCGYLVVSEDFQNDQMFRIKTVNWELLQFHFLAFFCIGCISATRDLDVDRLVYDDCTDPLAVRICWLGVQHRRPVIQASLHEDAVDSATEMSKRTLHPSFWMSPFTASVTNTFGHRIHVCTFRAPPSIRTSCATPPHSKSRIVRIIHRFACLCARPWSCIRILKCYLS